VLTPSPNGQPLVPIEPKQATVKGPADRFTVSQTLVVTDGIGLHQPRDGAVEQIRAGDVIVIPADVWHWHGAAGDHYMTHLSITESPGDGRPDARWGNHVTDHEYKR